MLLVYSRYVKQEYAVFKADWDAQTADENWQVRCHHIAEFVECYVLGGNIHFNGQCLNHALWSVFHDATQPPPKPIHHPIHGRIKGRRLEYVLPAGTYPKWRSDFVYRIYTMPQEGKPSNGFHLQELCKVRCTLFVLFFLSALSFVGVSVCVVACRATAARGIAVS